MTRRVSERLERIPRSGIREIMELAADLDDVIHLEVGEPSFPTADHIIDGATEGARAGYTRYTPNAGLPSLRAAVAQRASSRLGYDVGAEQVMVSTGAVGGLAAATFALVEAGDRVLLPDPGWPNYASLVGLAGGVVDRYPLSADAGYLPDPAAIDQLIRPETKAIVLNNPGNPTGAVFSPELVEELVSVAARHDIWVVSDEVYEDLVFEGAHRPAAAFDRERVLSISGCSKTYAMTGWRIGWVVTTPEIVQLMGKVVEPLVSCPASVSQCAAEAALLGPQEDVAVMCQAYARRRDLARDLLQPAGLWSGSPRGAFYALVDLRHLGKDGTSLALDLLKSKRVATAPGDTFGTVSDGMVRISFATGDDELAEGCRRIADFAQRR